jgi:hypothetical protein
LIADAIEAELDSPVDRPVMRDCPDCNCKGGYEFDPNYPWTNEDDEFRLPTEWRTCMTCKGKGKLSQLAYDCRIANGRPIAVATGYA